MVIKMKARNKIVLILIVIFFLLCIFNEVFALNDDLNVYEPDPPLEEDVSPLTDKVEILLGAIRNISVVVAVLTLMIIGVRYMLGSLEDKANYKTTMIPYVIGCVLAALGTTLVSFIYSSLH